MDSVIEYLQKALAGEDHPESEVSEDQMIDEVSDIQKDWMTENDSEGFMKEIEKQIGSIDKLMEATPIDQDGIDYNDDSQWKEV